MTAKQSQTRKIQRALKKAFKELEPKLSAICYQLVSQSSLINGQHSVNTN